MKCYYFCLTGGMCLEALYMKRSHGEERVEGNTKVMIWGAGRVQANTHGLFVIQE